MVDIAKATGCNRVSVKPLDVFGKILDASPRTIVCAAILNNSTAEGMVTCCRILTRCRTTMIDPNDIVLREVETLFVKLHRRPRCKSNMVLRDIYSRDLQVFFHYGVEIIDR